MMDMPAGSHRDAAVLALTVSPLDYNGANRHWWTSKLLDSLARDTESGPNRSIGQSLKAEPERCCSITTHMQDIIVATSACQGAN